MRENLKAFKIIKAETIYNGFFNLERFLVKHTLYQGGWSKALARELFWRGDCAALIPYDPITDQVVLIEQFRVGAIRSDRNPWLLEIVAGSIEPGETAREVAIREAKEEANCDIQDLTQISQFYTTPGGASEKITLFCGRVDATNIGGIHGLQDEGENIQVTVVKLEKALKYIETGRIESAIPIIALQWLELRRTRLKRGWGIDSIPSS